MRTKYERKPIRDGCWQTHKGWKPLYPNETGEMRKCRATLNPLPSVGYQCSNPMCGQYYTNEDAMSALAGAKNRRRAKHEWNKIGTAINKAKFTKTGDEKHDRAVDERIAMNSQIRLNGLPLMIDAGEGGFQAAMNAVITAAMTSVPAPTNMKEQ